MPLADALRVAVLGAGGRMGRTVCAAVASSPDLKLVAAIDPMASGVELTFGDGVETIVIGSDLDALTATSTQVAIDFTAPRAAAGNLAWLAANDIHAVCGTTGLSDSEISELQIAFSRSDGPNAILASNFAISAVLMIRLAAIAAPFFDNIEIVELHHENKVDAPSGTAVTTAAAIDEARRAAGPGALGADPTTTETMPGARGARSLGGVQLHSVRLAGLVAHQEVLLGTTGQSLIIRQDSYDRSSFIPGVLLATRKVASTPGFTRGLEALLGL